MVLALGEMCFQGRANTCKGGPFSGVGAMGEMCFQGMGAGEKGV